LLPVSSSESVVSSSNEGADDDAQPETRNPKPEALKLAIVGRPNVGKSTLFNALTGTRDALVADIPGLTRDRKYGFAESTPYRYIVVDTGGIVEVQRGLSELMAQQTGRAIEEADRVVFMVDGQSGLDPADRHVTAWVALSDSTPATGCVTVLPGSHRLGQMAHTSHRSAANLLSNGQQVAAEVDGTRVVPLVVCAGEFSLHHTHLLHSSEPNRGRDRRIGVGISYIPAWVRHVGPHRLTASLVRGRDGHGHFDPEPRPRADFDAEARAAHAEACARFFGSHGSVRTEVAEA
jgi:hypothetical protein